MNNFMTAYNLAGIVTLLLIIIFAIIVLRQNRK